METIQKPNSILYAIISFIGIVLLLIGIYAAVRTTVNVFTFEKYPIDNGFFSFVFSPYQSEADCLNPQKYYTNDGKERTATEQEKQDAKVQEESCLSQVQDSRKSAKTNDISASILYLFLGAGILLTRKFMFK